MSEMNHLNNTPNPESLNTPPTWQQRMEQLKQEKALEAAKYFHQIGVSSIVYAIICTLCLYKSLKGITNPIFTISTVLYMCHIGKVLRKNIRGIHYFCMGAIVLLGFSNFMTDNNLIIFYNYLAIFGLFLITLMLLFFDFSEINLFGHFRFMIDYGFGILEVVLIPISHLFKTIQGYKKMKSERSKYIMLGILISIPCFFVMWEILASADVMFNHFFNFKWVFSSNIIYDIVGIILTFLVAFTIPYASFYKLDHLPQENIKSIRKEYTPIIPIIVAGSISVLYIAFSLIQIIFLFMHAGTLPEGYTYAQYAREGFFQLLFVSALNGLAILICMELFKKHIALKALLLIISGCTFIMIASSAMRMSLYISTYGLTSLRIFVLWGLLVIFLLMLGLLYRMFAKNFNLFNYALLVSVFCYLLLSFSHYDYWIADYNFKRYEYFKEQKAMESSEEDEYTEDSRYVDYDYFMELSEDAAPVLGKHLSELTDYIDKNGYETDEINWYPYDEDDSRWNIFTFRTFNLSEFYAKKTIPQNLH
ncbi:MAG: DUF4173 domain-containing protein [Eubacterium sp.]|nr:DUF4173 domain-containing protein [Eubacterium sp.]